MKKQILGINLENPFNVVVDGSNGMGAIELPIKSESIEAMDEEESSGI